MTNQWQHPETAAETHARLQSQQAAIEMAARERRRKSAGADILIGLVLCLLGIVITVATYNSASRSGGTYVVAYGPIIFGAIRFFKGLANLGA